MKSVTPANAAAYLSFGIMPLALGDKSAIFCGVGVDGAIRRFRSFCSGHTLAELCLTDKAPAQTTQTAEAQSSLSFGVQTWHLSKSSPTRKRPTKRTPIVAGYAEIPLMSELARPTSTAWLFMGTATS
jgi:hypothetical protein